MAVRGPGSPAFRLVPSGPPGRDALVGRFGRAAAVGQPRALARAIGVDLWRFVDPPGFGEGPRGFGTPPSTLDLRVQVPGWELFNLQAVEPYYGPVRIRVHRMVRHLGRLQAIVRVHGPLLLLATILALAALPFARRDRTALVLVGGSALASLVGAVAVQEYNWRYAVPMLPLLLAAGAIGARVLALRLRGRRGSA